MGRLEDILKSVEENKVANPPVRRNVYVADLDMTVNTDLETPDEINYATKTQVLEKPKQEYIGLKETENPFKLAYNASVDSLKNVLDKVVETVAPTNAREPFKEMAKGAVVSVANLGNLSWGATKIFATNMAMNREMFADKNALEQSYMRREITQEEYFQKLKELTAKKTQEHNAMREFIGKDIAEDNQAFNQWLQDCGFTPDSKTGKFFYDLGGSITSIGASVIAFAVTKNPLLAISLISVPEFTSTYTEAIEKGKDADTAMSAGLTNYAFVTGSEFLGGKVLWSTLSKSGFINNAIKKITTINPRLAMPLASGFEEGIQESSQEVGGELINQYYDISQLTGREIINNALYSGLQAFLGASLFGGVAGSMQFNKIFENEKKELLKLKDSNGNKLYTPEQADQIAKRTADFVQSRELQDEILNISKAERDNSLSKEARNPKEMKKMIEDNLKKMETALPEIKKELMDIKTKVKTSALETGIDEEQATMVAEMTQARAMMYYNAFGITPLQFYYLNELEITVDENSNILSNGRKTGYTVRFDEDKAYNAIASGDISNIIKSIRTKENLNKFGDFVNKLVNEGRLTKEQRSAIYAQLAERTEEIPTVAQVVDRVREEEVEKFNQPAYHGTPHRFDEFSTEKIGTGEGAQAHGWGLYFAKNRETSERYKEDLEKSYFYKNELERWNYFRYLVEEKFKDKNDEDLRHYLRIANINLARELARNEKNTREEILKYIGNKEEELEKKIEETEGQLFRVEIPEDDVLLDEDKLFNAQPKKVQEGLNKLIEDSMYHIEKSQLKGHEGEYELIKGHDVIDIYDDIEEAKKAMKENNDVVEEGLGKIKQENGKQIYRTISDYLGTFKSDRDTSLLLNEYGIKGITYDGQQDGRAYVIFDDKAVKVLEKFYQGENEKKKVYVPTKEEMKKYHLEKKDLGTYEEDYKIALGYVLDLLEERKKLQKEYNELQKKIKKSKKKSDEWWKLTNEERELQDKGWKIYYDLSATKDAIIKISKEQNDKKTEEDMYKPKPNVYWIDNGFGTAFAIEKSKGLIQSIKDRDTDVRVVGEGTSIEDFNPKRIGDRETVELALKLGFKGDKYGYLRKGENVFDMSGRTKDYFVDLALIGGAEIQKTENKRLADIVIKDYNKPYLQKEYLEKIKETIKKWSKDFDRKMFGKIVGLPEQQQVETFFKFLKDEGYDYASEMPLSKDARIKVDKLLRENNYLNLEHNLFDEGERREQFVAERLANIKRSINNQNQVNNNRGEVIPRDINTPVTEQTKSIINVFSGGDRSTIIHEMAHIFLRDIEVIENQGGVQDEQFRKIKATLDKWLGKKEGQKYTREQQEKFASGFETYMATGQAPKEELKGVFDYFKKWMSQIYDSVKNMIPITPEVKNMFDEILTLQPVEQTPQTQTEGGNNGNGGNIVPVTPDAKDLGKIERKRNTSIVDFANKYIQPISTRLGAIDPRLEYEMKMFEARLSIRQAKYKDASLDFLKQTDELKKKSKQDYLNFDRALKNRDVNTINRITEKYPELKSSYEKIREMLDGIKAELKVYGVEGIENYFPRKINNIDGLMSYLEGTENWSEIERAMKQSDPNYKNWTEEKKAEFVASYLQGYRTGVKTKSAHTKQRKIDIVTDEMDRYYENSSNSLLEYINNISNFLETARLLKLGKDEVYEMTSVSKDGTINLDKVIKNIESILGTYVKDLVKDKKLTREQEKELAQLIRARFNFQNTNNIVSVIKSFGYLATLGNINAVITQFGDLSYSIDNAGIFGTLRAIFGKKKITMEDLGIDHPAEDFADGIGIMQKILNGVLKTIGFKSIDSLGKNTYIATTFMKYKSMIEKNEQKAFDDIARRYGDEFAKNIIDDIKNDRLSENIYLFAHSELSRVQPISMSEVPEAYLNSPTGRIFYSLKTFWIKQFNRIITDNSRLIKEGIKEKNGEKVKEGAVSMAKLIILFVVLGSGTDMLKDLIYLRKIDLEDTVFDNFLKLLGVSRYTVYKAREQGTWSVIADQIFSLPVGQMFDSFTSELNKVSKGKLKVKDLRIASNIPIVGNPYYWWLGGGRLKEKKKNKRRAL